MFKLSTKDIKELSRSPVIIFPEEAVFCAGGAFASATGSCGKPNTFVGFANWSFVGFSTSPKTSKPGKERIYFFVLFL